MAVYLIIDLDVSDPERFAEYQAAFPVIAARHGGRYLVRGGELSVNGDWGADPKRLVMIEFPDRAAAAATFADPDYQPLIPIRNASSKGRSILVDGVDGA
ncbi:MAG: DUF1330 domain-containing protein [Acidimicrobiales bacterium]|nr:DUF1330 domain-containing protein [Acidimicrobiales bacterium]